MIEVPAKTQSISNIPPVPPKIAIAAEPFRLCCKCKENEATLQSPRGDHYCEQCGHCKSCKTSVENFVKHYRMNIFVCPCLLKIEQEIQAKKEVDMIEAEQLLKADISSKIPLYITKPEQVISLAYALADGDYVMDLETTGLNPRKNKVITIALGTQETVWTIDVRSFHSAPEDEKARWKEALQTLFHQEGFVWIGHNIKFDWSMLATQFDVRMPRVYDTMIVERLIHNGNRVSASMLNTATRYGIKVSKEEANYFIGLDQRPEQWNAPLPPEQLAYIEQDIRIPHQIIAHQQDEIELQGLSRVIDLENAALPAIAALEVHGVLVDTHRWQQIIDVKAARKVKLNAEIQEVLGEALLDQQEAAEQGLTLFYIRPTRPVINLGSSQHLIKALAALGIKIYDGKAETLEGVKNRHKIVAKILEWKELEKFLTAFGEGLMTYVEDGRIHATFEQLGAVSGRIICREPNLQQMPKSLNEDENLRSCFVAPENHKLLVADLSNIELRILAEASGDTTMLRFFAEGKDLHSETARLMFNLGPDVDPKKHVINGVKARDIAKTINFGLAYGMGPSGLAGRVGVDMDTAKKLMQTYFNTYKGVDAYLKKSGRNGVDHGYSESLSGRRRTFLSTGMSSGEIERASKNHPIQGTNADILKRALALLHETLPSDVHIVLTIHDEIVLETPVEKVAEAENILKSCMMTACRDFLKIVAIPEPDVLVADYWVKG